MTQNYDVIIIGAGSIGVPAAMYLSHEKVKVLVLDSAPSPGQGSNKAAIGGVRATHSNHAKVLLSIDSLKELSSWQSIYGDDIEWEQGGYSFVAYDDATKKSLQSVVEEQKALGTGLRWLDKESIQQLIPAISSRDLLGGTYSGNDGSASPLKVINAYYQQAKQSGAHFHFNEPVISTLQNGDRIQGVTTDRGSYHAPIVINAAGAAAAKIAHMVGFDLPVRPNVHEAGVTEPVQQFLQSMIVDTRSVGNSSSIYFYQHATGQIIFCLTPDPPIWDSDRIETSFFLPLSAQRIMNLIPALRHVKVRRTWSGYYPMTPDGSPLLGWDSKIDGMVTAAGMCGQGFMLGPGIGKLLTRMVNRSTTDTDDLILKELSPDRIFTGSEVLK